MSFSVHRCLAVTSALLLLLCSSTSCLGTKYQDCLFNTSICNGVEFGYPFGESGSGCGDPDFQLHSCDSDGHPLINISGNEYHILEPSILGNDSNHIMIILNDNIWVAINTCKLSGNYNEPWWYGSELFDMVDGYTNLTFRKHCDQIPGNRYVLGASNFRFCGDVWYYSLNPKLDAEGTRFCTTQLQLPIKENLYLQLINNQTLKWLGSEITWQLDLNRSRSCGVCLDSKGVCGYDISEPTSRFLCYCPDSTSHPDKCPADAIYAQTTHHGSDTNKYSIVIGCSIGGIAITAIFLTYYVQRRKTHSQGLAGYERRDIEAIVPPGNQISDLPTFSYEELRQATNCFHKENEIGDGGYGSVYLGKLRDGRTVAIKRLYQENSRRAEQFFNEVAIFSSLNHPYVVSLFGYTPADSPELLLVYEFVSNGTLADHLHGHRKGPKGLPWNIRLNIAIQTAQALAFLHSVDPPIFHRDVKSSNILLDEQFNVKVADFGLCRVVPVNSSHVSTLPQGTPGYVDPEYHQCYLLTEKSDVYSFGVVLVEIISAKLAVDINRKRGEINLAFMAISKIQQGVLDELLDPQLEIGKNDEGTVMVSAVAELAFRCLASEGDDRPHMKDVVGQLEQIRAACPTPDERWGIN
eukprot:PITA_25689